MTPQERYARDPDFHKLVDLLTNFVIRCEFSPTELREAAVLAAIRYEQQYARPVYVKEGDSLRRVDSYHGREG